MAFEVSPNFKIVILKGTKNGVAIITIILYPIDSEGVDDFAAKVNYGYNTEEKRDLVFESINTQYFAQNYWNSALKELYE